MCYRIKSLSNFYKVFGCLVLQNHPHTLYIVLGITPVTERVEVTEVEAVLLALGDTSSSKGDLILRVKVEIPRKLNNKQKDLLKQFDDITGDREYENRKSFMDRVKEIFS